LGAIRTLDDEVGWYEGDKGMTWGKGTHGCNNEH